MTFRNPSPSQISFGQGPKPEAAITGPVGTFYYFSATKFDPEVDVVIEIFDSKGIKIYADEKKTDNGGSVHGLITQLEKLGRYKFIATGQCDRKKQFVEKYFDVTR